MGTSDSGYVNPEYDTLYEEMMSAPDIETVKKIAWRMQEMLHEDLPYLPLYEVLSPQAYVKSFTGFEVDWPGGPFGGYDWTVFLKVRPTALQTTTPVTSPVTTPTTPKPTTTPATTPTTPATTPTTPTTPPPAEAFPTGLIAGVIVIAIIIVLGLILIRRR